MTSDRQFTAHRGLIRYTALVLPVLGLAACGYAESSSVNGTGPHRSVQVRMTDQLRFDPGTLVVKAGETVQFQVRNTGKLEHEFVLGDQMMQDQHEQEMRGKGGKNGMQMGDTNAVDVPPGQVKTLTFTFPETPGSYLYGCHVTGHYAAGMHGMIAIT